METGPESIADSQRDVVSTGRYRLLVPVCEDSIGATWLGVAVRGPDAGRQVLVTIVPQSPQSLVAASLISAAREDLELRHSSLLALLCVECEADRILLVSEALEGEPLSTVMALASQRGEPIPPGIALRIVKTAVDGLRACRQKWPLSWPHGLLNPEAIFVASCGEVLLRQPRTRAAALGMFGFRQHPSVLPYQAPEMLRDDREDENCADVFAAGVLLWEMLAGRGLFGPSDHRQLGRRRALSTSDAETLRERILLGQVPALTSVAKHGGGISDDVARLVGYMLQKEPSARPPSLEQLSRALDSLPANAVASLAEVGLYLRRLMGETLDQRARLLAHALRPETPSSVPPKFQEPNTMPRAMALSARLSQEVLAVDEEPPPAAVVSIPSRPRRSGRREGFLAAAAGLLLIFGLGGYLVLTQPASSGVAASEGRDIDEARHHVSQVGTERTAPSVSDDTERAAASPSGDDAKQATTDEPSSPSSSLIRVPQSQRAKPSTPAGKVKPSDNSRTGYRPSGI